MWCDFFFFFWVFYFNTLLTGANSPPMSRRQPRIISKTSPDELESRFRAFDDHHGPLRNTLSILDGNETAGGLSSLHYLLIAVCSMILAGFAPGLLEFLQMRVSLLQLLTVKSGVVSLLLGKKKIIIILKVKREREGRDRCVGKVLGACVCVCWNAVSNKPSPNLKPPFVGHLGKAMVFFFSIIIIIN